MTEEERAHRKRMIVFAKRHAKNVADKEPLTEQELKAAIERLKQAYPRNFIQHGNKR